MTHAVAWFASYAALSIAVALLAGDARHIWWYLGTALGGATAFLVGALPSPRWHRRIRRGLILAAGAIALAAFLQGAGVLALLGFVGTPRERTALFFGNPNILAACLALVGLFLVRSAPPALGFAGFLVVVPAIMFTGSRGALTSLAVATTLDLMLRSMPAKRFMRVALAVAPVFALALVLLMTGILIPRGRNLLHESATPTAPAWQPMTEHLRLTMNSAKGPQGQAGVWSLAARTPLDGAHPGLILTQSVGRSVEGRSYVASVYLRSDTATRVVLSTNLSSVTCHVDPSWTRCATPPGIGDGRRIAQFQLRTVRAGDTASFLLWGAQLEYGRHATRVVPTTRLSRTLVRLDPLTWPGSYGWDSRLELQRDAWRLFVQQPWVGSGLGTFHERLQTIPTKYPAARHAQNLALNLLVETGVLGLLAWVVPLAGLLFYARRAWRAWLPVVVLMLGLNTTDATFFTAGFFYLFWYLVGTGARWGR